MNKKQGVLDLDYHEGREKNRALKYRLWRRTKEVKKEIDGHFGGKKVNLLDIGTADAKMLSSLCDQIPVIQSFGVDYSINLLKTNNDKRISLVNSDALSLPFKDKTFDIIIAMAVIEHVKSPQIMLEECHRLLKENGIIIISTPNPFFDDIATAIGHLSEEQHNIRFTLNRLEEFLKENKFEVLSAKKFMISPIGIIFEDMIESFLRCSRMSFLMCNQLIVGKKISS